MFRDKLLMPTEAVRMAALGILAEAPRHYGDLAVELRYFTSRIVGPSLDLMGTSLELLRYEGLIEARQGTGTADTALLQITAAGQAALVNLLSAELGTPINDMTRFALLLKLRFLHHLPAENRREQLTMIADSCTGELARLEELRQRDNRGPSPYLDWLDQDIAQLRTRVAWLAGLRDAADSD
jgi:DNA-binding PadR family transcriptional regulator